MYILWQYFTNLYHYDYTFLLSLFSISFAISVIITKNPIYSVLFLIGLFSSISLYLMILDLYFLGISYILVYVGAISILFLFILMLINIRVSELHTEGRNSIPLALVLIILINSCLESTLPYCTHIINTLGDITKNVYNYVSDLFGMIEFSLANATLKDNLQHYLSRIDNNSWDGMIIENSHIASIGNIFYTSLFIYIIVIALILLLAMVGSIVITLKK